MGDELKAEISEEEEKINYEGVAMIIARRGSDEDDNENGQEKEIELRSREDR